MYIDLEDVKPCFRCVLLSSFWVITWLLLIVRLFGERESISSLGKVECQWSEVGVECQWSEVGAEGRLSTWGRVAGRQSFSSFSFQIHLVLVAGHLTPIATVCSLEILVPCVIVHDLRSFAFGCLDKTLPKSRGIIKGMHHRSPRL